MTSAHGQQNSYDQREAKQLTRINEVVHQRQEHQHEAASKDGRAHDGHNPMDFLSVCPGKPKESSRNQDRPNKCGRESSLWWCHAAAGSHGTHIPLVVEHGANDCQHHANGDSAKGEAADTRAPSTTLLEDDGECGEAHVQSAVDDGHVDGGQQNDGLLEEQDPWSHERHLELRANSRVVFADIHLGYVDLTSLL